MNNDILTKVTDNYRFYKEPGLDFTRVTSADILPKIEKLSKNNLFSVLRAGCSIEGKNIYKISTGNGPIKVLLWSQMHGDEPTATKAIFDILNYFDSEEGPTNLRMELLNNLEIHFLPMLNPDGAEKFVRENSINIDLNRDARSLQCPESLLLQKLKDEIKPDFCFNLHDQNRYYSVGKTNLPPALSFLAPPIDFNDSVNEARKKAMQLIVYLNEILNKRLPGRIAKYSDDHEPRSFGDNFNSQDTPVILIESGWIEMDPLKEKIRELNFTVILAALFSIASKSYSNEDINKYAEIPENENRFFDLLLKGAIFRLGEKSFIIDIGINRIEKPIEGTKDFYIKSIIEGLGDLSTFTSHQIIDCTGLNVEAGKVFTQSIDSPEEFSKLNPEHLFNSGFTTILCNRCISNEEYIKLPFNIVLRPIEDLHTLKQGSDANIVLKERNRVKYLVVNGILRSLPFDQNSVRNGLIFR